MSSKHDPPTHHQQRQITAAKSSVQSRIQNSRHPLALDQGRLTEQHFSREQTTWTTHICFTPIAVPSSPCPRSCELASMIIASSSFGVSTSRAALVASARTSCSSLSASRNEISALRLASRASFVAETCLLYRFSHLAAT